MNNGCCSKCQAKSKVVKKSKKLKEESDEEDVKEKQEVPEKENPKTDSREEKGSQGTSDEKDEKNILKWKHESTNKEKGHRNTWLSLKNGVYRPCNTARSMMYHGGPNPLNQCPISAAPRGRYPPFAMAPMYGPYGGGGPFQPYQSMTQATMYNGAYISPYPPMAAAFPPPYWQTRPFTDANPMTRYTSYTENYSYCFI